MKTFKNINRVLSAMIGIFVAAFVGYGIYAFWDYTAHPEIYQIRLLPWYTNLLVYAVFVVIFVTVMTVVKLIVCKKA